MKKFIIAASLALSPVALVFAQNVNTTTTASDILKVISRLINTIIPILIAAGVAYFIWGVIQYVTAKDEESQTAARNTMISGVIGLFVIVAVWGLVSVIRNTFGLQGNNQIKQGDIPCIPGTVMADGVTPCPVQ